MEEDNTILYNFKESLESFKFDKYKSGTKNLIHIRNADKIPSKKLLRFFIFLIPFALILSYFIIPKDSFSPYKLNLGEISDQNIKAPFDIEIEDIKTTDRKKQEKLESIPPVFDYDPSVSELKKKFIVSLFKFLSNYFQALIEENKNQKEIPQISFEELNTIIIREYGIDFTVKELKELFGIMKNGHNDQLLSFLNSDIIDYIYEKKLIRDVSELNKYANSGILIKNIETGKEEEINIFTDILDLSNIQEHIKTKIDIFILNFNYPVKPLLYKILNNIIEPNITFNRAESEKIKNELIEGIPKVFFSKKKGEKIIGEGERATESQVMLLDEINRRISVDKATYSQYFYFFIYSSIIVLIFFFLLLLFHPWHALSNYYNYFMILALFLLNIFIMNILWHFYMLLSSAFDKEPFVTVDLYLYALPYAFGVLMLSVLLNSKTALTFGIFQICFYVLLFNLNSFQIIYIFIGIASASIMREIIKKKNFYIKSVLILILLQSSSAVLNSLISGNHGLPAVGFILLLVIISGFSVYVLINTLIPLFEWIFRLSTDMKLLELLDFKHPLLEKLMFTASGTLHHSIAVANLAEVAARSIGCNAILCRVASYYHDIGKINKPEYFIENITSRENKHDRLKPSMSALILISHVKSGYDLGKKFRLPAPILEIIQQHHGTALIKFFYDKAVKNQPDDNKGSVSEDNFRYPGPKPYTKESAIILIADRVEATSRILINPSTAKIKSMVENIVKSALLDGDLDNANLSLFELSKIIESFCNVLYGSFHKRIDYPDQPESYKI